jgi:hypothetical protein
MDMLRNSESVKADNRNGSINKMKGRFVVVCVQVKIVTEGSTNNVARFYPAVRIRREQMFIENYPAIARRQKIPAGCQHN